MSEFHDPFPNYEMLAHHDEVMGKKIRKKLWGVFWLLLFITIGEIIVGLIAAEYGMNKTFLKCFFIGLTIVKAYFIVYTFMHLGDENRKTKWIIIGPFVGFVLYLIVMLVTGEGNYQKEQRIDKPIPNETIHQHEQHHEAAPEKK